jgi:hypothetical protein
LRHFGCSLNTFQEISETSSISIQFPSNSHSMLIQCSSNAHPMLIG